MSVAKINADLDYIEKMFEHLVKNPDDPMLGWAALCEIPDICGQLRESLTPWYKRLWLRFKPTRRYVDDIPF